MNKQSILRLIKVAQQDRDFGNVIMKYYRKGYADKNGHIPLEVMEAYENSRDYESLVDIILDEIGIPQDNTDQFQGLYDNPWDEWPDNCFCRDVFYGEFISDWWQTPADMYKFLVERKAKIES